MSYKFYKRTKLKGKVGSIDWQCTAIERILYRRCECSHFLHRLALVHYSTVDCGLSAEGALVYDEAVYCSPICLLQLVIVHWRLLSKQSLTSHSSSCHTSHSWTITTSLRCYNLLYLGRNSNRITFQFTNINNETHRLRNRGWNRLSALRYHNDKWGMITIITYIFIMGK